MIEAELRDRILASPEILLEDREVMNALVAANERAMGSNVVDLRSIAMEQLENKLNRLEDTHRSVIAAAYENLVGTNQIHRVILQLLEPLSFEEFLSALGGPILETLRVDCLRLVLESRQEEDFSSLRKLDGLLVITEPGFVDDYTSSNRLGAARSVTLRQINPDSSEIYGTQAEDIRSEALMRLDFGEGRLPGLLALGSENPHQFRASQGGDLLAFLAGAFERIMRRYLS